ncbi:hypothetical protein CRG98_047630, partial [Punica granatum]
MAALGGTNISLRKVTPRAIFDNITRHGVTHMGGAPTVLNMIVNSPASDRQPLPHPVVTPCAFVKLKEGCQISDYEIIDFCRARLPHYMAPRTVVFEDLPQTSTGK